MSLKTPLNCWKNHIIPSSSQNLIPLSGVNLIVTDPYNFYLLTFNQSNLHLGLLSLIVDFHVCFFKMYDKVLLAER